MNFLATNMQYLMIAFALFGAGLIAFIFMTAVNHQKRLRELSSLLVTGLEASPASMLQMVRTKGALSYEARTRLRQNLDKVAALKGHGRHWPLEMALNLLSALIQVFPMLGVLGTIVAIGQSPDPASFSQAIQSSVLGLCLAVVFLLLESLLSPYVEKVVSEGKEIEAALSGLFSSSDL